VRRDPKFANCHDIGNLTIKNKFVYRLVKLALILPVATATVKMIFLAMKIIRTELRNKIGNDWSNHRIICYVEREIFFSIEDDDILYHWQDLKNRLQDLPHYSCK
jgi:hypothetical protein